MRIILLNSAIPLRRLPEVPEGNYGFACVENFSVGPLKDWDDPTSFYRNRAEYYGNTSFLTLPDGGKNEYFIWHQHLPEVNFEALAALPDSEPIPIFKFEELAPGAEFIEIWSEDSVRDHVWRWYVAAELSRLGVDRSRVSLCEFKDSMYAHRHKAFWKKMISGAPDRSITAAPVSETQWQHWLECWEAAVALPDRRIDAQVQDDTSRRILAILAGRHPDAQTGLNNIQKRLLANAQFEWTMMALVVGETMGQGVGIGDNVGDLVLRSELEDMARMDDPCVEIKGSGPMRDCSVRLTEHGRAVRESLSAS